MTRLGFILWGMLFFAWPLFAQDLSPARFADSSRQEIETTNLLFKALLWEQKGKHGPALELWKNFPPSPKVREHLILNGISLELPLNRMPQPQSERGRLLLSSYLSMQRQWAGAYQVLEPVSNLPNPRLEQIRLQLLMGRYEEAHRALKSLPPLESSQRYLANLTQCWLNLLLGDLDSAQAKQDQLEQDFLYPTLPLLDLGLETRRVTKERLAQRLLLDPSDAAIQEAAFLHLWKNSDLEGLAGLVELWVLTDSPLVDSELNQKIEILTAGPQSLEKAGLAADLGRPGFDRLDLLAQAYLRQRNWTGLFQTARRMRELFPELQDGVLFEVIALEKSGEEEKANFLRQKMLLVAQ